MPRYVASPVAVTTAEIGTNVVDRQGVDGMLAAAVRRITPTLLSTTLFKVNVTSYTAYIIPA